MSGAAAIELVRSYFYRFQPALPAVELSQRLVDLSDVACRCSNDDFRRKSIMHTMVILIGFQ
jgi:hypothetical protein